jgi:imidazole glycerol-phosphate synthase subunit HisH
MPVIAVIDYDMGNLHSACKGLENAGATPQITDSAAVIAQADAVVLPGVGSFDPAMQHLRARHLEDPIKAAIASGKPFLGICLGLQILFDASAEGTEPGLGIIPGTVKRFQPEPDITIPHMGWNQLDLIQRQIPLWENLPDRPWLYFVHSYYVDPLDPCEPPPSTMAPRPSPPRSPATTSWPSNSTPKNLPPLACKFWPISSNSSCRSVKCEVGIRKCEVGI